ncbi:unnamed protein product [Schistocephalus solidus]|uniref:TAXi_C domain-containing protein n=1 Tax=Schistocephalus solidus TaxID=70667 RepID=A0A183TSZ6_SCHSO|nr:unnamed protein product [Schistocephalus solidus]
MFPSQDFCFGAMAPSIVTMASGSLLPQQKTLTPIGLPMTDVHLVPGTTVVNTEKEDRAGEGVDLINNSSPALCLGSLLGFQALPPLGSFLTLAAKGFKLKVGTADSRRFYWQMHKDSLLI